uniref:putative SNAP25 homologous protein SNAP30 n=1 Tax=Erigeron canadensis TaxID=72917 RepID=UPI001CB9ABA6|nr:putative SNAP25 homologous protein SNAP30 [Erigeron canadensis]
MGFFRKAASPGPNSESETEKKDVPARRTTSEPVLPVPDSKNPFDDEDDDDFFGKAKTSTLRKGQKSKAELDGMSNQELEHYAVDQAEETTKSVNNCLKIAEDIRQDANKTLDTLHAQGEQIHRTHEKAADMEKDLSKGEKILGSLGGMFSATWKPKKGKEIKGPDAIDDGKAGKKASKGDREKLGLDHGHHKEKKDKKGHKKASGEPKDAMEKVEMEKEKQDEALDELSSVLGDLKGMAGEMGSELDRQNKALDSLSEDVDEINNRVKGANTRARKLISK